jgi:hypothetical protein
LGFLGTNDFGFKECNARMSRKCKESTAVTGYLPFLPSYVLSEEQVAR